MGKLQFRMNAAKATEVAATFLRMAQGRMDYTRLLKLMYLADRKAIDELHRPITGDVVVNMKRGPVLSGIYNLIKNDHRAPDAPQWHAAIGHHPKAFSDVVLKGEGVQPSPLSRGEVEIIESVFVDHERRDTEDLIDWIHDHCAEWSDPRDDGRNVAQIAYERIFEALGKTPEQIEVAAELEAESVAIDKMFAAL